MRVRIENISEENLRKVVRANQKELYEFARRMIKNGNRSYETARDFIIV